jgi:hypothetical protein
MRNMAGGWETLFVASVPAALTAASLIYQQHRTDRRETAKAERDAKALEAGREEAARVRAEEREAEQEAYRRQLASEWRAERREVHTRLLTLLDTAYEALRFPILDCGMHPDAQSTVADVVGERHEHDLSEALHDDIERAASAVELLGSKRASDLGGKAARVLLSINTKFYIGEYVQVREVQEAAKEYERLRREYQQAAREDLGTAD